VLQPGRVPSALGPRYQVSMKETKRFRESPRFVRASDFTVLGGVAEPQRALADLQRARRRHPVLGEPGIVYFDGRAVCIDGSRASPSIAGRSGARAEGGAQAGVYEAVEWRLGHPAGPLAVLHGVRVRPPRVRRQGPKDSEAPHGVHAHGAVSSSR
jgi:hypothetical protein